ncbi:MAG: DUF5107 domain-containing protein [Gemmatimonadetes bacterium]|nr:DUF5107 domain-containing protein [Gemmatimonadota bacterium]MDA1103347.1 DUF5107 domain-containing protein [Gemmatimonadota bacterium]
MPALRPISCRAGSVASTFALVLIGVAGSEVAAQTHRTARISEETRVLETYSFSEPDAVPILTRDARLYPYHRFVGYAHESAPKEWKVVHLENDYIEVWVLPEVGGKVWGARVKESGHEFIYRNEVMKFRNISLRGPWTSGGIEFNFGVIGHTPATATPVDYVTRTNDDGSVSVFVGAMDLPSRTNWRVEVRLPADRAYFETNVLWQNPTTLEQPYYNWMTGAAFAREDLVLSIPGNAYLEHPGAERSWPFDDVGRELPLYAENRFGGNKSYHVVGELNDHFGGYYADADYGFGHWSRYEEMPGQKLWLWSLSRQGGIWEDLLTDTDGQYVEFQAGRLLVQYSPGTDVNPISQVGFDPGASDRWSETWFPVEGLGGLTDASRDGAMFVRREGRRLTVNAHAFGDIVDTLRVTSSGAVVAEIPVTFEALRPVSHSIEVPVGADVVVDLRRLGVEYRSDPDALALSRPFATDAEAMPTIPDVDRKVMAARELVQGRELAGARRLFEEALSDQPWNREALLGLADLEYRRGRYREGLRHADRVLQLDAYDAAGNFAAGNLYRGLRRSVDAREAFGWAARSMAFRSVSFVQLGELAFARGDLGETERFARSALDYDRFNLSALQLLAMAARARGNGEAADSVLAQMLHIDPLHHFERAERYLAAQDATSGRALAGLRGEYPEQELLELATIYERRGAREDAVSVLALGMEALGHPILTLWHAWLTEDSSAIAEGIDPSFVFPYRVETITALEWAVDHSPHWSWSYLLALNLWARDRSGEAAFRLATLGDVPDHAPFYVSRAHLVMATPEVQGDPEADLRRAVAIDSGERLLHLPLIQYLQDESRWDDALAVSAAARDRFPGDFTLGLLHVTALNQTQRFGESIEILDAIRVLPSEHASSSHQLFADAHTMAALDAAQRGAVPEARRHLQVAMTWPERLGLGRPYEPEERLQRYLLGALARAAGDEAGARMEFEAVVTATPSGVLSGTSPANQTDLLGASALAALGRAEELAEFGSEASGVVGRLAAAVRSAVATGGDAERALARALESESEAFTDVQGRLVYGALTLSVERP